MKKKRKLISMETSGTSYVLTFDKPFKPSKPSPFNCEIVDKNGNLYLSGLATVTNKKVKIKLDHPVDQITVSYDFTSKRKHS